MEDFSRRRKGGRPMWGSSITGNEGRLCSSREKGGEKSFSEKKIVLKKGGQM